MSAQLNYSILEDYFKSLSEKHVDIKDFCGTSRNELANKLTSHNGIQSPILILYNVTHQLSGHEQRTFNTRTVSFCVAYAGVDVNDFDAEKLAKKNAETIGLEILSRINIDSKMTTLGWLYNNFLKDTANYTEFEVEEVEGLFGMEFTFDLKTQEPLVLTKAKWTDGNDYC